MNLSWQQVVLFIASLAAVIVSQRYAPASAAQVVTFVALALNFVLGRKQIVDEAVKKASNPPPATEPKDKV